MLGRLGVRYPEVPIVFAGSRKFAEEWTYRFFAAAAGDLVPTDRATSHEPLELYDRFNALVSETRPPQP
jgi:hypothetical protein